MSEMADIRAGDEAGNRAARRTNLMLAATIEVEGHTSAVRIRNVSETGALIDGQALPEKGAAIFLKRGELRVGAIIAWFGGDRCGVRFDRPVPVGQWTGTQARTSESGALRDQERVDAIQAEERDRRAPEPARPASAPPASRESARGSVYARLADELAYVQRMLDSMGDELIAEPVVVARHARTLQNIDLARQILGHLAAIVVAEDPAAAVERIGLEDLRARLKRKPLI